MKPFELSFAGVVVRFFLMMAVIIVAGFSGYFILSLLALPIFLSGMMAVKLGSDKKKTTEHQEATFKQMGQQREAV